MDVIGTHAAPPMLLEIIEDTFKTLDNVGFLIVATEIKDIDGKVGATQIEDNGKLMVLISLDNCVKSTHWVDKGMLYIPNVWYNMLYAVFHEAAHCWQLVENPELVNDFEHALEIMEHAADIEAISRMFEWSKKNEVPTLREMGWAGEQIQTVLNGLYARHSAVVDEELDFMNTDIVAKAAVTAANTNEIKTDKEMSSLIEHIKNGSMGKVVKGQCYLSAEEFFGLHNPQKVTYTEEVA